MRPIIELSNATKEFRGVKAFADVNFDLNAGEVHALLGENGAGKSTLAKVIAGVYNLSAGKIFINGELTALGSPSEGLSHGIAVVYQENSLVPSMTVAQNIYLGNEHEFSSFTGYIRLRSVYIAAQQFLQSLSFHVDPTALVSKLGAAQKQMVEIARAVHHKAKVIIFDEPTATLTPEEKRYFFALVKKLRRDGVGIIFISHALEEALELSDRITVLRDGKVVASDVTTNFDRQRIIKEMVGRELSDELYSKDLYKRQSRRLGRKVISVENVSMGNAVKNCSFSIYAGQVTGMFGLVGAGRTEMMKIVSGVVKRDLFNGGIVKLDGKEIKYKTPGPAVRSGIVYVTEERKAEGFFETMSISENIYVGQLADQDSSGLIFLSKKRAREIADYWNKRLSIKAIDPDAKVIELSGGNQQKVVVAKALIQEPQVVIFDEPTRGVDVGAIAEIHDFINELADQGIAVVMISSYLPEIMKMSDRILIARQGKIVEEMEADEADEEKIMYAAVH